MNSYRFRGGIAAAITLLAAWGTAALAADAAKPKAGGSIVMGLEADFPSLDPLRISAIAEREAALAVYDPLFDVDQKGDVVPYLARSSSVSEDGTVYTIKLRAGVKFHDGTSLDAAAVVFNMDRDRDPKNSCRCLGQVDLIDSVRAVDPLTVEIKLKEPSATLPSLLTDTFGMVASPTAIQKDPQGFGSHPVGTGPFVFKEWMKGDHITFTRNADYWNQPLPHADQVTFRPIPSDESREATLISGGINVNENPGPKSVVDAEKTPALRVVKSAGLGSVFIMFNTKHAPTDDVRVRRALAFATDRKLILKALFYDLYDPIEGPFAKGSWAYQEHVPGFPTFDLQQAKALAKDYGKPIEITLTLQNTPLTVRLGEVLQSMWGKIGVKTTLKQVEQHLAIENALTKEYQAEIFRWAGRPDPDGSVYKFFYSKYATVRSSNYTAYTNPAMDKLLDAGLHELDQAKRQKIYADVSGLLAQDVPYSYLFAAQFFNITAEKVHGLVPVPDGLARVRNIWLD